MPSWTFRMRTTFDIAGIILFRLVLRDRAEIFNVGQELLPGDIPLARSQKCEPDTAALAVHDGVMNEPGRNPVGKKLCDISGESLIAVGGPLFSRHVMADTTVHTMPNKRMFKPDVKFWPRDALRFGRPSLVVPPGAAVAWRGGCCTC